MDMNSLSVIVRHSRTYLERELQHYDIGYSEEVIMMYLLDHADVSQETISRHFILDKGSIAKTMTKMEDKHLVRRYENPANKREKLVSLTATGKSLTLPCRQALDKFHHQLFQGLTQEDRQKLSDIIRIMEQNAISLTERNQE